MDKFPDVRKIACLRATGLGDFVAATPALSALRQAYPDAEIVYLGTPLHQKLLEGRPGPVDRVIVTPRKHGIREEPGMVEDPAEIERFFADMRRERFDLAIQMHGSGPESNDFVAALGAPVSLGYTPAGVKSPLTKSPVYPGDQVHEANKWLGLVAHVGATSSPRPHLPVLPAEKAEAEALLAPLDREHPIVALHAGSRDPARRWPPERFAALADQLWDSQGCQIVLTGSEGDVGINALVRRACRAPALDLSGKTSLGGLAAVLDRVDLLVTNDSGPSHIAWARGVCSVVLFGPTDPARWAPLDRALHPTVVAPGRDLQNLKLAAVWPTVATILAAAKSRRHLR